MTSKEIRSQFIEFFKSKAHKFYPSAPIVNKSDSSLLFINSGMNQFKDYFLDNETPKHNRIANSQKCLRVSGKHNDLDEVGYDTYHHTMFEMLGNWSFGDYFKKEAIAWAWELLTEVYKIEKDNLYVTIFEGSKKEGLPIDIEAYNYWKRLIPENRILNGSKKDNFWEMGEQGPCGPCSEIHIDLRSEDEKSKISGQELVNKDHPQVVEIWNLVFMEFNRSANGKLIKLPQKHIDTGMGFERLCMVLQNKTSNYDTDVFTPIIREIETITKTNYGINETSDIAIRVIADHVRAVAFSIADGQLPSNTGAGYVIRRILRRAVRYYFTFLNAKVPIIYKLVGTLIAQFSDIFPNIKTQKNLITNVIREEENSFLRTLDQGLILLDTIIQSSKEVISGEKVFELYDTYGFPIDLTELIIHERDKTLDKEGFEAELEKQKKRSKVATESSSTDWVILKDDKVQEFIGYDYLKTNVSISRYRKIINKKDGELYQLVFNVTPFYAEGGGQVGDKGYLKAANGDVTYIIDTKKENNLSVHIAKQLPKNINAIFTAVVDSNQRHLAACNHTATHLLHQALRKVLGNHVEQKGSMVHSGYLRFDFSHFSKISKEELQAIEDFVNARINEQITLEERRNMPYSQAIEENIHALFGEKYGDVVRVVTFGKSAELCGGTHVENTGNIWHFIIKSESAVASGIRRIEAITSQAAKEHFITQSKTLNNIKQLLKNNDPEKVIHSLQNDLTNHKKLIEKFQEDKKNQLLKKFKDQVSKINSIDVITEKIDLDPSNIKDLCFQLGQKNSNLFILFGSESDGKAILTCYISKELVQEKKLNAEQIIRELGKYINGGGGGQPFFATAGGKNPDGITEALNKVKSYL